MSYHSSVSHCEIIVTLGIQQGAIIFPTVYNKTALVAQSGFPTSCIVKGTNISIMCYADDPLNLILSVASLGNSCPVVDGNYKRIDLSLNATKLQVLLFNCPLDLAPDVINLGGTAIKHIRDLIYLDLSIDHCVAVS